MSLQRKNQLSEIKTARSALGIFTLLRTTALSESNSTQPTEKAAITVEIRKIYQLIGASEDWNTFFAQLNELTHSQQQLLAGDGQLRLVIDRALFLADAV